jgi:sulfite exporter TauE/SafE
MKSKRLRLGKEDLMNLLKVLCYTAVTAILATLLDMLESINLSENWYWIIPAINVILVALKKLITNEKGKLIK